MLIVVEKLDPKERQNHDGAQNIGKVSTRPIAVATQQVAVEVYPYCQGVVDCSEPNEEASIELAPVTIFFSPADPPKVSQVYHNHDLNRALHTCQTMKM